MVKQQQTQSLSSAGNRPSIILISILFFLSGSAGLIYQTVWVRLLELYFGVTLTAITLIVSAYMMGLGLGSLIGGRIATKKINIILLYGLIEAGVGGFGVLSPTIINWIGQNTAGSPYYLVFLLSFAILLIPTLLMGMTLPLLTQAFVTKVESSGQVIGLLYGINTFGAATGALVSGYFLMGWLGFNGTLLIAATINFLVGLGAIPLRINNNPQLIQAREHTAGTDLAVHAHWNLNIILMSAFLVGFIGMGFEMLWFRLLGIFTKNTAYSFPSIIFIFLVALAIGGWYWGNRADRSSNPVELFWKLQLAVGVVTAATFFIVWLLIDLPQIQPWLQNNFETYQQPIPPFVRNGNELILSKKILLFGLLEYFLPIIILILPAGLLMGGGLPILDRISIEQIDQSGRRVGDIHLANIFGSVFGTLVTSLIFLPLLGSELTFKLLSILTLTFLVFAIRTGKAFIHKRMVFQAVTLLLLIAILPGKGEYYTRLYQNATNYNSIAVREEGDSVLILTFRENKTNPAELWIGGIKNSFFPSAGAYERSAITCGSASHPRRALIIGIGGANTANLISTLPGIEEVVIVELLQDLGDFLDKNVPIAQAVFDRSHVQYIVDDGRRYLYANPDEKFDLIFIDPLWSFSAGHNNLYSTEAMRLYQSHLTKGGVLCAWISETHIIPKTAASVFDYSDSFGDYLFNSNEPLIYDMEYLTKSFTQYIETASVHLISSEIGKLEPEAIIRRRGSDQGKTLEIEMQTPVLTDLTPWLEYYYICPPKFVGTLKTTQLQYCSHNR